MWMKKSFTMIEMLVVIIIVGVVVALALPDFGAMKEKSLNREAKTNLALIQAAEKIYKMEQGFYYPYRATTSTTSAINSGLKLALTTSASRLWSFSINSTVAPEYATATRTNVNPDGRIWRLEFQNEDPTCSGGTYCP
ncbi:MAG: type II secretion system protein [Candidatus Omnitrophota bacterium]